MVNYSFGINIMFMGDEKVVSRHFGVITPGYAMLSYLSEYDEEATASVIENLEQVISGEQEESDPWGTDFCVITSSKDVSEIQYHDFDKDDWQENPLFTEMPTVWLLDMMKDWALFLAKNPRKSYN
jgi:hypothetical protein